MAKRQQWMVEIAEENKHDGRVGTEESIGCSGWHRG